MERDRAMRQTIGARTGALAAGLIIAATLTAAMPARAASGDAELTCLAQTIYFEARGATDKEKVAVGHVVLNRSRDSEFPDSICGVVHQKAKAGGCAFSWACDGRSDRPRDKDAWAESLSIARQVLDDKVADPTRGALYFHSRKVKPDWKDDYKRTATIGDLMFYRPGKQTAAAQ
jgi:spore germination cell wall hydrolase CwlJ-like protein